MAYFDTTAIVFLGKSIGLIELIRHDLKRIDGSSTRLSLEYGREQKLTNGDARTKDSTGYQEYIAVC